MIYYSTGKSAYLPKRGKPVPCTNQITADILIKKGSIVVSLEELEQEIAPEKTVEPVEEKVVEEKVVKPIQKKVVKPKGRPKKR